MPTAMPTSWSCWSNMGRGSPGSTHGAGIAPGLARRRGAAVKVCPVVLRGPALLAFRHPRAGVQLVKGKMEPGEAVAETAARELREESGVAAAALRRLAGARIGARALRWRFVLMRAPGLPDRWSHWCEDDGGHLFRFFWHPLARSPGRDWHPVHRQALAHVRAALRHPRPGGRR